MLSCLNEDNQMVEQTIKCPSCGSDIPLTEALSGQIKEGLRSEYELKAKQQELELRKREEEIKKRASELEVSKKSVDEMVARKLDAEREKIKQSALEMFSEEHRLRDLEKDKKIADMLRNIEELKRRGEQGSQQNQGEVLELDLEAMLRARFPVDVIEPVAKGVRGAAIIQRVYARAGQLCGSIAWESKRTKAWNDEWVTKLKDDQREVKAELAVIVTEVLPKGITAFG